MSGYSILYLVVGLILFTSGITGLSNKTRKGQRLANLVGEGGARMLNIVIGIGFIVASFYL